MSTTNQSAASLYDSAARCVDEAIKHIEEIPVNGLHLTKQSRTAARLLNDAYDLWHGLTRARDAIAGTG